MYLCSPGIMPIQNMHHTKWHTIYCKRAEFTSNKQIYSHTDIQLYILVRKSKSQIPRSLHASSRVNSMFASLL